MSTIALTMPALEPLLAEKDIVIIDFWAPWCGPCRMFGPVFEEASVANPEIAFAKCNTEEQTDLAGAFGISSIPTLAVFRGGVLLYKEAGALPKAALNQLIDQVKNLDMVEVRRQIEEQKEHN